MTSLCLTHFFLPSAAALPLLRVDSTQPVLCCFGPAYMFALLAPLQLISDVQRISGRNSHAISCKHTIEALQQLHST